MTNEFSPDLITLMSDEGNEVEFEILDIIENEDGKFYVLYPYYESQEQAINDCGEYYIFEVVNTDGEEELAEIADENKLKRIADIFESNYNEILFSEDD